MSGLGHIGELQIIDDLQKNHKFEIYLPLKDKGLDFIGLKNNSSIQVQLKTSKFQKNSTFRSQKAAGGTIPTISHDTCCNDHGAIFGFVAWPSAFGQSRRFVYMGSDFWS